MSKAARRDKRFKTAQQKKALANRRATVDAAETSEAEGVFAPQRHEWTDEERQEIEALLVGADHEKSAYRNRRARGKLIRRIANLLLFSVLWAGCSFVAYLVFKSPDMMGSYAVFPAIVAGLVGAGLIVLIAKGFFTSADLPSNAFDPASPWW